MITSAHKSSCKVPPCFRQILMEPELEEQLFEKYLGMKFNENPFSVNRVFPRGRSDRQTDRQTDMTKPIVSFLGFANVPKTNYLLRIDFEGLL